MIELTDVDWRLIAAALRKDGHAELVEDVEWRLEKAKAAKRIFTTPSEHERVFDARGCACADCLKKRVQPVEFKGTEAGERGFEGPPKKEDAVDEEGYWSS